MFNIYPPIRTTVSSLCVGDRLYGGRITRIFPQRHGDCVVYVDDKPYWIDKMVTCVDVRYVPPFTLYLRYGSW